MDTSTEARTCTRCGKELTATATKCPACGINAPLDRKAEAASTGAMYVLWFVGAFALVGWGFVTMYLYSPNALGDGAGQIVGGDSYNYIIIALRGIGFMLAGVVTALAGVAARKVPPS